MFTCKHPSLQRTEDDHCGDCGAGPAEVLQLGIERLRNGLIHVWVPGPNWSVLYDANGRFQGGGGVDRPAYRAAALAHGRA